MKTAFQSGSSDYMIISGTSDGNTYVSSKSGGATHIRGGGNNNAYELVITSSSATFAGNVTFNGPSTKFNTDGDSFFEILDAGTDACYLRAGASDEIYMGANNNYQLRLKTNKDVVMDNGGNFGIGTTSPAQQLDILYPSYIGKDTVQGLLRLTGQSNTENGAGIPSAGVALEFYNKWTGGAAYSMGRISARGEQSYNGGLQFDVSDNTAPGQNNFTTAMSIDAEANVGIGTASPDTKLDVKDGQDSSLYSGLKVERSANTTAAYLNAVGGALNLNTNSSMPIKLRIQNASMQTINPNGGRAYVGFGGWRMFEYSHTFSLTNGATLDLFQNTSAHTDLHMVQIAIRMFHSGRTYFVGSGVVGGYGMNITGSGSGHANGGLTSAVVSSGIRKLQIYQGSGYTAQVAVYIQFRLDSYSGINVLNGTLSTL